MRKIMSLLLLFLVMLTTPGCEEGGSSDSSSSTSHWATYPERPWVAITPSGIKIITDTSTIEQYEELWGDIFHWEQIDWNALDEEFMYQKQYYCYTLNWDCKHAAPSDLTVYIKPWDSGCKDEETPSQPKEIYVYLNEDWRCVDGWYHGQITYFHLGDDPGIDHTTVLSEEPFSSVDYRAFQESAYPHELLHFFQAMAGLSFSEDIYIHGYRIILPPDTEEEEKE